MNNISIAQPTLSFQPEIAQDFLYSFGYNLTTLQLLTKTSSKEHKPTFAGKYLWNKNKGSSCVTYVGSLLEQPFLKDIYPLQHEGLGVFFMVNEGDGIAHPPATTPRSAASVTTLKAIFIDTDNGDIKTAGKYLLDKKILPHYIVESSPGKFHLYLLLEDTAIENQDTWKRIQEHLFNLDKNYDSSMADTAKLLRLPGFYHTKGESFLTRIVQDNSKKINRYQLEHLYSLFDISSSIFIDAPRLVGNNGAPHSKGYVFPHEKITEGSRHQELISFLRHESNHTHSKDSLVGAAVGHVLLHFSNPSEFLPGGLRYAELLRGVDDVISYAKTEEEKENLKVLNEQPLPDETTLIIERTEEEPDEIIFNKTAVFDEFSLPDEFYFNAPGIIGEITKYITERALYPAAPFAFATVCGAIGTLKAKIIESELGHYTSNYFLCLGVSGSGKSYAQDVMVETLRAMNAGRYITSKVRSEQGIHRFLEVNKAKGLIMLDEAENFFTQIQSSKTEGYLKTSEDALLSIYNHGLRTYQPGFVGNKKDKPITLEKPRLNIVAFGVPDLLFNSFNHGAIIRGLLQRFLVLTHNKPRMENDNFEPARSLPQEFIGKLRELGTLGGVGLEDVNIEAIEKNDAKEEIEIKPIILKYESAAKTKYRAFLKEMNVLGNKEATKFNNLEGLYTRAAEQVGRLSLLLSEVNGLITEECVDFSIKLVYSRVIALVKYCKLHFKEKDSGAKGLSVTEDAEAFIKWCYRYTAKKEIEWISYRQIQRGFSTKNSRLRDEVIVHCLTCGLIEQTESQNKSGPRSKMFRLIKTKQC